jgi:hypothetical protein
MSGDPVIRIAVASDLHAHDAHKSSPSHLNVKSPRTPVHQHPIASLQDLIEREKLRATILLSPGDLGHQADVLGISYGWDALAELSKSLGADLFTATVGNHDMDSRYKNNDPDPEHILKNLEPSFPFGEESLDNKYWARKYAIRDSTHLRLLVLNSSAFHGNQAIEKNHGRVNPLTIDSIRKELDGKSPKEVNVLLCHHHPQSHSELKLGEDDVMKQGQLLLDLIGSGTYGRWLVIHGHKHHPKITYAAGASHSPVVFSAGSLCSTLYPELQSSARNQFYIIEIDANECAARGLVGRIKAWDWSFGIGWIEASTGSGLPSEFGFGTRQDATLLAQLVANVLQNAPSIGWSELTRQLPELAYLLPQDLRQLESELGGRHNMRLVRQGSKPFELGRIP